MPLLHKLNSWAAGTSTKWNKKLGYPFQTDNKTVQIKTAVRHISFIKSCRIICHALALPDSKLRSHRSTVQMFRHF